MFMVNRLHTGLLRGDPDAEDSQVARTSRGLAIGLVAAVAVALVVTLYGFVVSGGASSWRKDGTVVLVKDSGARMLYLRGVLHPVLNQASARLVAGGQLSVAVVSAKSLSGTAVGTQIGIVGAPESLPAVASLSTGPWSTCLADGHTAVTIGTVATARPLATGQAVLAAGPDHSDYLLWNGHRWRIGAGAVAALGYDSVRPLPMRATALNVLPPGADLAAPGVPQRGQPGPALAGQPTRVGQLFTGAGGEHYLLRADGLVPLTDTGFALLRGDPATQRDAYVGTPVTLGAIGPDDLARHRSAADPASLAAGGTFPAAPPTLQPIDAHQALCLRVAPGGDAPPAVRLDLADPASLGGPAPAVDPGVAPSCEPADEIRLAAGTGAVVRTLSTGGGVGSEQYLVADVGVKYPMSAAGANALGYAGSAEVRLPSALLAMLPTGPRLDRDDALAGPSQIAGQQSVNCR
jgi:type VII secretion protein EccB